MGYEFITTEVKGRVALITLNRPRQLNALAPRLMLFTNSGSRCDISGIVRRCAGAS